MSPSVPRALCVLPFLLALVSTLHAQPADLTFLPTRAEATDFRETTRYEEVRAFLDVVEATSDRMHQTTFGYSVEGRPLPLMVYGDVADASPEAVRASGKTRVFIQANIHAGEVCGKEAALMLLRGLAAGQHAAWADSLVLLVAPIYNADGNERVSLYHRRRQNGPIGGMGQRPNAQELDLNRDHMKLDAPEARALVGLMNAYDPHVAIDLHTTNGTYHAYHLTYAPPLHPNTAAPLIDLLRGDWLPSVSDVIRSNYGWETYYYGNLPWPGSEAPRGWYTFDHRPRFNNNYVGLRNRLAILSEAYAYASFEERVLATLYFVEAAVDYAHHHAGEVRRVVEEADARSVVGEPLALRAQHARAPEPVTILMGAVEEDQHPFTGEPLMRRLNVVEPETMDEYGTFAPTETTRAPAAYYVPAELTMATDLLRAHGVRTEALEAPRTMTLERFRIDSTRVAERAFQGRFQRTLFGAYETAEVTLPAGTVAVPVDQPLGRLVFALLEPRSDDGLVNWGQLDAVLVGEGGALTVPVYPVLREAAP